MTKISAVILAYPESIFEKDSRGESPEMTGQAGMTRLQPT